MSNDMLEVEKSEVPQRTSNQGCCWHRYGDSITRDCSEHYSMRAALQDPKQYEWPGEKTTGVVNMYKFNSVLESYQSLVLQRRLGISKIKPKDHQRGSVEQRCVSDKYEGDNLFRRPVAVKELRNKSMKEVEAMIDLRHPHIALLLTTFTDSPMFTRIVTFPAGCCDLGEFMLSISSKLQSSPRLQTNHELVTTSDQNAVAYEHPYQWPYEMELKEQLLMLRRYFLCLCQALTYLHSSPVRVRHKDIKPENIVIDIYGNVVLIDFSISRKFDPENLDLTSRRENDRTDKYRTPENDVDQARDGRSDVWALGCVFLEMVSLLFKISLPDCEKYCSHVIEGTKGAKNVHYVQNGKGISDLLNELRSRDTDGELAITRDTLSVIGAMLSESKEKRPLSKDLWKYFDFPGQGKCPDCHPNSETTWLPTANDTNKNHFGRLRRIEIEQDDFEVVLKMSEENKERVDHAKKTLEILEEEHAKTSQDIQTNSRQSPVLPNSPESANAIPKPSINIDKENMPPSPSTTTGLTSTQGKLSDPERLAPNVKPSSRSPTRRRTSLSSARLNLNIFNPSRNTGSVTDLSMRVPPPPRHNSETNEASSTKDEIQKSGGHQSSISAIMHGITKTRSSTPPLERKPRIARDDRIAGPSLPSESREQHKVKKRNTPPTIAPSSDTLIVAYSKSMKCLVFMSYDDINYTCVHFKLPYKGEQFSIQYSGGQPPVIFNLSAKKFPGMSMLDIAREHGVWVECSEEEKEEIALIPVDHPDPIYPSRYK